MANAIVSMRSITHTPTNKHRKWNYYKRFAQNKNGKQKISIVSNSVFSVQCSRSMFCISFASYATYAADIINISLQRVTNELTAWNAIHLTQWQLATGNKCVCVYCVLGISHYLSNFDISTMNRQSKTWSTWISSPSQAAVRRYCNSKIQNTKYRMHFKHSGFTQDDFVWIYCFLFRVASFRCWPDIMDFLSRFGSNHISFWHVSSDRKKKKNVPHTAAGS